MKYINKNKIRKYKEILGELDQNTRCENLAALLKKSY
jgi:hypothetical protein